MSALPTQALTPFAAVIVAAGKGLRTGLPLPKQFARWRGEPVLRHSAETLAQAGAAPIVVAIPPGADELAAECLHGLPGVLLVTGGETRQQSVAAALECLAPNPPARVLIHDAARPILPMTVIERLLGALEKYPAAIPVLPVVDSLAVARDGAMAGSAAREELRRVQTPQAFRFQPILEAHRQWNPAREAGDDAQVAQAAGLDIALTEGDERLRKLTFSEDFVQARPLMRVGTGFDVHRLAEGEELWLAGVRIDHSHGLSGHSDADVAIHALVDALLGAIGEGDIGSHFPPSDPQWRGARSGQFLTHAAGLVRKAGYEISNCDLTIICEAPRIGPHREAMRRQLAELAGLDSGQISVKATTTERLGFTGRKEGIAAEAVVCLIRED
ncbi:bifunctional 2-C-methyl-D-erythritol 4-phosphate cytidylyltransferase/2-C-methyl-D-erythritol 2,4-cyclodiphosphate synthase [Tsuneonella sp. CC-YZS046]|uniref:bifunctional 2-C-methyl-D-erythritol 4-phosphate cytidylyltransferase/2-C-methyl-D-erythritol 2,4-cyclodiphosphate synthase n=1 Tax=Tsuneonella sp. CC-YZS046 TaxID=3042152 RepID=UPI002D79AD18|nr:bifunctional 2-C-methyl-D-erythritol 4-phosphate cytidylyltransferase/2-C-methyl-D-erythritol 2,4-cyclodiphosphate synthase [Tsuneonella sp. CC-YZS046]WRO67761.1 bifunctional 2-C-methyl-D-erythritol 4-phosphate cytidylyltransferase/2-C-methyl-D-erythritol 2,4-cyclodiphosphate synthase [Tsuneonella sp. CC-YZS046]